MVTVTRPELNKRAARRSFVATIEIITLACAAHVVAGGDLPAPDFVAALSAVVFIASLLTYGRGVQLRYLVPIILAAQVGLHAGLDTPGAMPMRGMAAPSGPDHLSATMLWAHLVVTMITAIVLLNQDRVAVAVTGWFSALLAAPHAGPRLGRSRTGAAPRVTTAGVLVRLAPRRGPPSRLLAPA